MMKFTKIILTLLFSCLLLEGYSQHYIGVSGGTGRGSVRMFPYTDTGGTWGMYSGGVSYKYYGGMKYVGGIESDLLFLQQGYTEETPDYAVNDTTRTFNRKINSLVLPILWQPHVNLFNDHMRVFVNIGVVFSYNINSTYEIESEQNGFISSGEYRMLLARDNRWGYGLGGGAGINVVAGRFDIGVEGRYYYGFSDVLKNTIKYETNPLRSALDNITISMSLYYRFGGNEDDKAVKAVKIKRKNRE